MLSRVAELYDPCGWWEPLKVQMKLTMQHFNGHEWTSPVPEEKHATWVKLFTLMNQVRTIAILWCIIPTIAEPDLNIRILTVTDATAES